MRKPKVLLLLSEQLTAESNPRYPWSPDFSGAPLYSERALATVFTEKGFEIIGPDSLLALLSDKSKPAVFSVESPLLSPTDALNLGLMLQADIIVTGTARAEKSMNVMAGDLKSYTGRIEAKAYKVETGEEIASTAQKAVAVNKVDEEGEKNAIALSGGLVGEALSSSIMGKITKKKKFLEIVVGGTDDLGNFVMFRKTLNRTKGVRGIQIREIKSDEATIDVDYKGAAVELAEALMLRTFDSFGINLYDVEEDHIRIELVPK